MSDTVRLSDVLLSRAHERGFRLPKRFEGDAELPPDITTLSGSELMRWMTAFTSLVAYAATEEAQAAGQARAMAARYKQGRAQRYIEMKSGGVKMTEKQLDYELDADDELVDYRKEEILSENYARLVKAILSGYEAKYGLLSRELTRRGLAAERHFD